MAQNSQARAYLESQGVQPEYFNGAAYATDKVEAVVGKLLTKEAPAGVVTNGDYVRRLVEAAKLYRPIAADSLVRNTHMHDLALGELDVVDQGTIDAVLTDFLNYVAARRGMDLALYSSDLAKQEGADRA